MSSQRFVGRHAGASRDIDVEAHGDGRYTVSIDGVAREVDAKRFEAGTWNLLIDDQSYDVELEIAGSKETAGDYNVLVRGCLLGLNVQDERRSRLAASGGDVVLEGPQVVNAPMPGKIVKLLVEVGSIVNDGQPLVVIEAMKMENELRAPTAGTITQILVEEGQAVEARTQLITLE